jgi:hypothetical protein
LSFSVSDIIEMQSHFLTVNASDKLIIPETDRNDYISMQVFSDQTMNCFRVEIFFLKFGLFKKNLSFKNCQKKDQMKNLKVTQAIITIMAEYFRPEISRPSPIWPATSPEKNPWSSAACVNNRLY